MSLGLFLLWSNPRLLLLRSGRHQGLDVFGLDRAAVQDAVVARPTSLGHQLILTSGLPIYRPQVVANDRRKDFLLRENRL
jgi:hypothetical protein